MATLDSISGEEPSTVSFKLRTVRFTQNSSAMHAEVLVLGDPDSTNALTAVLNTAPASTAWGLVVRPQSTALETLASAVKAEDAPHVSGDNGIMALGVINAAASILGAEGDYAPLAVNQWGQPIVAGSVAIMDAAGVEPLGHPTDAAFAVSQAGVLSLAVRKATPVNVTDTDGDYEPLQMSAGRLWVSASGASTVAQASTVWAVQMSQYSTTVNVSSLGGAVIVRSSAANALVTAYQSTAADLQATVTPVSTVWAVQMTQYSTTMAVSSLGGAVIVRSSAANALVTAYQSTAADFQATVSQAGTWTFNIGTHIQSTGMPSTGSSGVVVRQALADIQTTASSNGFGSSTSLSVMSSAATTRGYVTAYSITTTNAGPTRVGFYSSNTLVWPLTLAAVSSAVSGVNLAVAAPGYLFRTVGASDGLELRSGNAAVAGWKIGVSYFKAP